MKRSSSLVATAAFAASLTFAATGPPLASVWNIATSGRAASSGDLSFRITANDGSKPIDITVPVISGAGEGSVARSIQQSLSSQLPGNHYSVRLGEGSNVLVSDPRGMPSFSLELVDSDIENVRVAVQSVTPSAPPTVPPQSEPAAPAPAPDAPHLPNISPPSGKAGTTPAPATIPPPQV